jgi:aspartate kinase
MFIVMKFGGTSVGSATALQNVIRIAQKARNQGNEIVLVVSAMSGVTDLLLRSARSAETGDINTAQKAHVEMLSKHSAVIGAACRQPLASRASGNQGLGEFDALCAVMFWVNSRRALWT